MTGPDQTNPDEAMRQMIEEFRRKYTIPGHAEEYPDKAALVQGDRRIGYGEYDERINRFGNALKGLGLQGGDRFCILLHNGHPYLEASNAAVRNQMTMVPISYRFKAKEMAYIIENSESRALVFGEEFLPEVDRLPPLPGLKHRIVVGRPGPPPKATRPCRAKSAPSSTPAAPPDSPRAPNGPSRTCPCTWPPR
ncbi:MAG: AMP-binding protein [Proteobacteria bacterium]|nr:AMP-binding protein [Pseudomonadota bacterium]